MPTETRARFHLLLVSALLAAWSLASLFVEVPPFDANVAVAIPAEILRSAREGMIRGFDNLPKNQLRELVEWSAQHPLGGRARAAQVTRVIGSLTAVLIVGLGGWALGRVLSESRAVPVGARMPSVEAELGNMSRRLGLVPGPQLAIEPGMLDGRAASGRSAPVLVLHGDPYWLERCWNDLDRATLLHEIGHIVNRDLPIREVTRSTWLALGFLCLTSAALLAFLGRFEALGELAMRSTFLGVAAWWLWAGMVRDRELYADQRVVSWGFGQVLARRLSLSQAGRTGRTDEDHRQGFESLRRWLIGASHPTYRERVDALNSPRRFFRLSPSLACAAGGLMVLPISQIASLLHDLMLPVGLAGAALALRPLGFGWIPVVLVVSVSVVLAALCHFMAGSVGVQALRQGVADSRDEPRRWQWAALLAPALSLATGLEVGLWLWLRPPTSLGQGLYFLAWTTGLVWTWLALTYATGTGISRRWAGTRYPMGLIVLARFTSAMVLALLAWLWLLPRLANEGFGWVFALPLILCLLFLLVAAHSVVGWVILRRHRTPCGRCGSLALRPQKLENRCEACGAVWRSWLEVEPFDFGLGLRVTQAEAKP